MNDVSNAPTFELDRAAANALANATQRLIGDLQKSNPHMKIVQSASSVRFGSWW